MTEDPVSDKAREARLIRIGEPPLTRPDALRKLVWIVPWLVFLSSPVHDLVVGGRGAAVTAVGWAGLTVFTGIYLVLLFRNMGDPLPDRVVAGLVGVLGALAVALTVAFGGAWLGLFVYVSVSCGSVFQPRGAYWTIPLTTLVMLAVALTATDTQPWGVALLVALIGFSMTGVRQLIRTTIELRLARATVARLAANEERLRLARDLHDLLGHSLSLITLKSELAGRMLPGDPEKAARQVADIEQVSRQALVDVREAVTGYRRPRLPDELAGAQVALGAAGVVAELPGEPDLDGLPRESESVLAWALREAVTNVVRHSGATRCAVSLVRRQTLDGPLCELSVEDNGAGGPAKGPGNGLTGLSERLEEVGGTLEAGRVKRGFRLVARVPLAAGGDVGSRA
ncbi:sensor histidine kinase [Streptomyces sp. NPDC018610]|uniref:sensor histidine kinase n=1 Tax=Streptomyces sp. NPDC018610 TaxID=3365049 RepID=UPI0037A4C942